MFKKIIISFFVFIQIFILAGRTSSEVVDRIVAVVNNEVITKSEINEVLMPLYAQYKSTYDETELTRRLEEARTNILNQMIEDRLILQEAKSEGIEVTAREVEERLNEVKSQFADEEEFKRVLQTQDLTVADLKEKYSQQLMIKKLINREVRYKIEITPTEVFRYYQMNQEQFRTPEMVKLQTILIRKTKEPESPTPKERIEQLYKSLKEGKEFSKLAKEYSEDPSAERGGDMGYISKGEMMSQIDEVIFSLNEGKLSDIIETRVGYHIFRVTNKREPDIRPFEDVRVEIENLLFQRKAEARFDEWMDSLKENAYISIK
jgi:parvulin-like peptidyl-prolyl isomerase